MGNQFFVPLSTIRVNLRNCYHLMSFSIACCFSKLWEMILVVNISRKNLNNALSSCANVSSATPKSIEEQGNVKPYRKVQKLSQPRNRCSLPRDKQKYNFPQISQRSTYFIPLCIALEIKDQIARFLRFLGPQMEIFWLPLN
jgi:hypothetical protein